MRVESRVKVWRDFRQLEMRLGDCRENVRTDWSERGERVRRDEKEWAKSEE